MISSDRFGGRGTTARSRVQIGSTVETESGTVVPTQQQARRSSERQLFSDHVPDIDVRGAFRQGVKIGIVGRVRVGTENGGLHIDINIGPHVSQAAATFALHGPVHPSPPQVLVGPSGL